MGVVPFRVIRPLTSLGYLSRYHLPNILSYKERYIDNRSEWMVPESVGLALLTTKGKFDGPSLSPALSCHKVAKSCCKESCVISDSITNKSH